MDEILAALRDYAAIIVACIAGALSIFTLVLTTRLTEGRERRKVLWEREQARFAELEDVAGRLVEELLRFNTRGPEGRMLANEKLQFLRTASGRFLRYDQIAGPLRDLEKAAGWYISEDMKHDSRSEYEQARVDVSEGFRKLIVACDDVLKNAPKGL